MYLIEGNVLLDAIFQCILKLKGLPEMFFHVKKKHLEAINKAKESGIPPESLFLDPKTLKKPKKSKKVLKEESLNNVMLLSLTSVMEILSLLPTEWLQNIRLRSNSCLLNQNIGEQR